MVLFIKRREAPWMEWRGDVELGRTPCSIWCEEPTWKGKEEEVHIPLRSKGEMGQVSGLSRLDGLGWWAAEGVRLDGLAGWVRGEVSCWARKG